MIRVLEPAAWEAGSGKAAEAGHFLVYYENEASGPEPYLWPPIE